jgi:hypothetical protein
MFLVPSALQNPVFMLFAVAFQEKNISGIKIFQELKYFRAMHIKARTPVTLRSFTDPNMFQQQRKKINYSKLPPGLLSAQDFLATQGDNIQGLILEVLSMYNSEDLPGRGSTISSAMTREGNLFSGIQSSPASWPWCPPRRPSGHSWSRRNEPSPS